MYRFKGIFDLNEREIIYNAFILAHFNYCPMVWHFCGKASTKKMNGCQWKKKRVVCFHTSWMYRVSLTIICQQNIAYIWQVDIFKALCSGSIKAVEKCSHSERYVYVTSDDAVYATTSFF